MLAGDITSTDRVMASTEPAVNAVEEAGAAVAEEAPARPSPQVLLPHFAAEGNTSAVASTCSTSLCTSVVAVKLQLLPASNRACASVGWHSGGFKIQRSPMLATTPHCCAVECMHAPQMWPWESLSVCLCVCAAPQSLLRHRSTDKAAFTRPSWQVGAHALHALDAFPAGVENGLAPATCGTWLCGTCRLSLKP